MSAPRCERCRPEQAGPAVVEAVDGTRLCEPCARFVPGTVPLGDHVIVPAGYEPLGTGSVFGLPVVIDYDTKHMLALHAGSWHEVAIVLEADADRIVVACPTCEPPRPRKRKAPRPLVETVATHRHGRAGEVGPVVDRAPHHVGPGYIGLDPFGHLTTKSPASAR